MFLTIQQEPHSGKQWDVWVSTEPTNRPEDESEAFVLASGPSKNEAIRASIVELNAKVEELKKQIVL
jgi:hypothetical protein